MPKVSCIKLLKEREALEVHATLHGMRNLWEQREPTFPFFFTVGAAGYIDIHRYAARFYQAKAKLFNPILRGHFGWLYERLVQALERHLGEPVTYWDILGLPGFNIFLGHKAYEGEVHHAHYDEQEYMLPAAERTPEGYLAKQLSFTLPITLPKGGSGLEVWDLHARETKGLSETDIGQLLLVRQKHFYPYLVGELVLHSGLYYHRIPPFKNVQFGDERITLQGHGIFCQNIWQLYW